MISFRKIFKKISYARAIQTTTQFCNQSVNHQVKIMKKLVGQKVSGSKKRWYPQKELLPTANQIIKTKKIGKDSSRRIAVLNKLFMRYITDLLATGEASQEIIGKGVEISKIKVNSDFHGINVYWVAKGDLRDFDIEAALNRCSGVLRHELSQLYLMGEVPKINFVKDKLFSNLIEVENILKNCDFGEDHEKIEATNVMREFAGYYENEISCLLNETKDVTDNFIDDPLPPMRFDVFGLDHKKIMDKILTKMKKSKKAWEMYESNCQTTHQENKNNTEIPLETKEKLSQSHQLKVEGFEKFLKRKQFVKNTPERKRNLQAHESYTSQREDFEEEVSHENCSKDWDGDYIEEYEKDKFS